MAEIDTNFYDGGVQLDLYYVSPEPDVLVHIFHTGWQQAISIFNARLPVGRNRELLVQVMCEPNSLVIVAAGKRVFEGDPNLLFPFGSWHYWEALHAQAPYNHQKPTQGRWSTDPEFVGTFDAWSDETPHIREIRLFHAQAATSNFFTGYVLAYERLLPLEVPQVPDPEPEPEPEEGGNGSSVGAAIYAGVLPFHISIAQPVAPVMWIKVRLVEPGDYEFTTATPTVVDDPTNPDTFLALYDSQGLVLDSNDDVNSREGDYRSRVVMKGMSAGVYFVAITGYDANALDGFDIEPGTDMPEDVNFAALAYVPPPPPPLTKVTLPYREDFPLQPGDYVYWYEIAVPAGSYKIDTRKSLYPGDNDTAMVLFDSEGAIIHWGEEAGGGDYRDFMEIELLAGTYRLALAQYGAQFSDGFQVKARSRLAGGVVLEVMELLPGDGSSQDMALWARSLPFRQSFESAAPFPVLWYEVEFEYGYGLYVIDTKAHSAASADTFLALFDSAGNLVAKSDTFGVATPDVRAKLSLFNLGGKYYLALGGAGCDASHGFNVQAGPSGAPAGTVLEIMETSLAAPEATRIGSGLQSFPAGAPGVQWFQIEYSGYYSQDWQFRTLDESQAGTFARMGLYSSWGQLIRESLRSSADDGREYLVGNVSRGTYYLALAGEDAEFFAGFEVVAPKALMPGVAMRLSIY